MFHIADRAFVMFPSAYDVPKTVKHEKMSDYTKKLREKNLGYAYLDNISTAAVITDA